MTETIFSPQSCRTLQMAGSSLIAFARNIDDEDSLIVRNITAGRTVIVPFSRFGDFALSADHIEASAIYYNQHLFRGRLTKTESHHLMDFILKNYDLVFNYKPEAQVAIEKLLERDRVVIELNGEKIVDAS